MTKLRPAAVVFRAMMERERPDWPPELVKAATFVRNELDAMRFKNWETYGIGPRKLKEYTDEFARLYAEWQAASLSRG